LVRSFFLSLLSLLLIPLLLLFILPPLLFRYPLPLMIPQMLAQLRYIERFDGVLGSIRIRRVVALIPTRLWCDWGRQRWIRSVAKVTRRPFEIAW
jgi:hypothetical protein